MIKESIKNDEKENQKKEMIESSLIELEAEELKQNEMFWSNIQKLHKKIENINKIKQEKMETKRIQEIQVMICSFL